MPDILHGNSFYQHTWAQASHFLLTLSMLGKNFSWQNILKYFSFFYPQKIGFDVSCKWDDLHEMSWETVCLKFQSLISGKKKRNIISTLLQTLHFFKLKIVFFLFLHKKICCGYSLEVPWWGASNKYPQHIFSWRNKKNIMWIPLLIWG